jgi:hypothetical protein
MEVLIWSMLICFAGFFGIIINRLGQIIELLREVKK